MAENEKMEQGKQAEKAKKPEKKSKPGIFARMGKWLRELKAELKKVQWPSAKQTINNTLVVILCVVVVGVFIWLFDALAVRIIDALFNLFGASR